MLNFDVDLHYQLEDMYQTFEDHTSTATQKIFLSGPISKIYMKF